MAVNIRKFELGKDVPVEKIRQFFQQNRLDRTQVLDVSVIQKTPNASVYLLTYEDVMAPYVIGSSPADGSTGVPVNSNIVVQMSEAVQPVVPADIEVRRDGVVVPLVAGDIVTVGSIFTISNAIDGTTNANYVVTLNDTIQDLASNRMEYPHVLSFTTATDLAGLALKADRAVPQPIDIAAGYLDVVFTNPFTTPAYRLSDPSFHYGAPISGVVFRITDKVAAGFRINFDFAFPPGGSLEWIAIYGAPS